MVVAFASDSAPFGGGHAAAATHRMNNQHDLTARMEGASPLSRPETWNEVASGYAQDLVSLLSLYAQDAIGLAQLPPDARVLDIATGPGTLAALAAQHAASVVAIDFAENMIRECERRTADLPNVDVMQADGQALPFDDDSFDGVFSMFGLIFFPDRSAGFEEARRVLRPHCRAVMSTWAPLTAVPLLRATYGALEALVPDMPFGDGKAPLADEAEFAEEMRAAGFRDVRVHTVEHGVEVPSASAFWAGSVRSSAPIAVLRQGLDPAEWEEVSAGVLSALENEFGSGPLAMTWPARLASAVR